MTGWVGYAVGNPEIIAAMSKLNRTNDFNLTAVSQYATIEALTGPQDSVETMRPTFETVEYHLLSCARVPGFEVKPPKVPSIFSQMLKSDGNEGYTDVTGTLQQLFSKKSDGLITGGGFGAPENVPSQLCYKLGYFKKAIRRLHINLEK